MNRDDLYIHIPELIISEDQKNQLLHLYYEQKHKLGHTYVSKTGKPQELTLVGGFDNPAFLMDIVKPIPNNYIDAWYFLSNFGVNAHIDDNRQCILSYEIQNYENIPLSFFDNQTEIEVHYKANTPILWNTQFMHGSKISLTERIFFQIEMKRNNSFEFYLNQYKNGKLIN